MDPIQSVKGKVVIDAFRNINQQLAMMGVEPRQTTSHIGHLNKPSIQVHARARARAWLPLTHAWLLLLRRPARRR